MDRAKIISSCRPKFWRDKQRNHHKIRPAYVQLGLTAEQKKVRLTRFRRDVFLKNWEIKWTRENLPELIEISRSLAKKTTVAANVFYAAFGLILFFLLRLSGTGATVDHSITDPAFCGIYPTTWKEYSEEAPARPMMSVHIEGTVTGLPEGSPVQGVKAVLLRENGTRYDSTYTDSNGWYVRDYNPWVLVSEPPADSNRIYPNPSSLETHLIFIAKDDGYYNIDESSLEGRVFRGKIYLTQGTNRITVKGGKAGAKLYTIYNEKEKQSFKSIQFNSTGAHTEYRIESVETPLFKSMKDEPLNLEELVTLKFTKDGYYLKDTSFYIQENQIIDQQIQKIPFTYQFWIYAYSILEGEPVFDNTSIKINWGDGSENTYSSSNGLIHIQKDVYSSSQNIWIRNADTTFYQEWIYGIERDPYATTKKLNLFQSPKNQSPENGQYVYPTATPAVLSALPDTFDMYFVPNWVYDCQDQAYNTRGEVFREVVRCRGPPGLTKKWEYVTQVIDTIPFFEMQVYGDTLNQITEEESLKQKTAMDSVDVNISHLKQNGRQLIPPHKRVPIYTKTEPEWIAAQARGMDQTFKFEYDVNNNNGCAFTMDYTFGDYWRFKWGLADYTTSSSITYKIGELFGGLTNSRDPPVGNLGGLVVTATGSMTSFGKVAGHMIFMGNPGTIYW